mgnify:CR=1 FL=1
MKIVQRALKLSILSVLLTNTPTLGATFNGSLESQLQIDIDNLVLFNLENLGGATQTTNIVETGSGSASATSSASTLWEIDDTFSFIELSYDDGQVSGSASLPIGFASAQVLGSSNRLRVTNTSVETQILEIEGDYSVDLSTSVTDPLEEVAEAAFNLELVTASDMVLFTLDQEIEGNDSFSDSGTFTGTLTLSGGTSEIVFLRTNLNGNGSVPIPFQLEPVTVFWGLGLWGTLYLRRKKSKNLKKLTGDK